MQNRADEELMVSYQNGDVAAMDEILTRYKNPVYRFSFRLCRDAAEAEDITQEVFLRIHRTRDQYRQTGKFSTWIFSIAHNLCITRIRKLKWLAFWPHDKSDTIQFDCPSPSPSPQEEAMDKEVSNIVKECIQGLPFLQKEALILREYENLNYEEIALILGKPLGTIKTLIHRARQTLKEKLLPYIEEGGLR